MQVISSYLKLCNESQNYRKFKFTSSDLYHVYGAKLVCKKTVLIQTHMLIRVWLCLRRWPNIGQTLGRCVVFARIQYNLASFTFGGGGGSGTIHLIMLEYVIITPG